jgi:uncharacterized protein
MSSRIRALASCTRCVILGIAVVLTGCAGSMSAGPGRLDVIGLNNALNADDVHTVRSAVASGVNPDARIPTEAYPDGAPLMAIAACAAALRVLQYLISAGADVNGRTPVNETPLMLASFFFDETLGRNGRGFERHEQAVRLLVAAGAELENDPHHYTPLAYAAYQGNERVVRFLIERGARVDADAQSGLTYVNTPLMMAAIQGHEHIADHLLRSGADPDIRVHGGHTAAELAARHRHARLARTLQCAQRAARTQFARSCGSSWGAAARPAHRAELAH